MAMVDGIWGFKRRWER